MKLATPGIGYLRLPCCQCRGSGSGRISINLSGPDRDRHPEPAYPELGYDPDPDTDRIWIGVSKWKDGSGSWLASNRCRSTVLFFNPDPGSCNKDPVPVQ
jgi:hypothetical protein